MTYAKSQIRYLENVYWKLDSTFYTSLFTNTAKYKPRSEACTALWRQFASLFITKLLRFASQSTDPGIVPKMHLDFGRGSFSAQRQRTTPEIPDKWICPVRWLSRIKNVTRLLLNDAKGLHNSRFEHRKQSIGSRLLTKM